MAKQPNLDWDALALSLMKELEAKKLTDDLHKCTKYYARNIGFSGRKMTFDEARVIIDHCNTVLAKV